MKTYRDVRVGVLPLAPKLRALDRGIKAIHAAVKDARTRGGDAAQSYRAIWDSLEQPMQREVAHSFRRDSAWRTKPAVERCSTLVKPA